MIAYGRRCLWWDDIAHARVQHVSGLLHARVTFRCPGCAGLCDTYPNENEWLRTARRFEEIGHPGHVDLIWWLKGRCYKTLSDARSAFIASRVYARA